MELYFSTEKSMISLFASFTVSTTKWLEIIQLLSEGIILCHHEGTSAYVQFPCVLTSHVTRASAPVLTFLLYNQLCGEAKYYCSQQSVTSEINLYTCEVLCFRIISGNVLINSDCSLTNEAFYMTSLVPLSFTKTQSTAKPFSIQS